MFLLAIKIYFWSIGNQFPFTHKKQSYILDLFQTIYRHSLFTSADMQEIISLHKEITVTKNDHLLKERKISDAYYLVEKGSIRFYVHDYNGDEITTQFICENEIANEVSSLFQRIPSVQNIQAVTDAVVWKIDFNDFQHLYHTMESVREWGRKWMSAQLFQSQQRSIEIITHSASSRYLHLMAHRLHIVQQAPLKQIASYLGIADTSLSRIRKEICNGQHLLTYVKWPYIYECYFWNIKIRSTWKI